MSRVSNQIREVNFLSFGEIVHIQEVYRAAQGLLTKGRDDKENGPSHIQTGWALFAAYISLGIYTQYHYMHTNILPTKCWLAENNFVTDAN